MKGFIKGFWGAYKTIWTDDFWEFCGFMAGWVSAVVASVVILVVIINLIKMLL